MSDPNSTVSEPKFSWGRLVLVAILLVVATLVCGVMLSGNIQQKIADAALSFNPQSATEPDQPAVAPEQQSTSAPDQPVVAPEQSTTAPDQPAFTDSLTSNEALNQTVVYTYTPGGPNYAWPEPGSVVDMGEGWQRIVKASNGQYLPWTFNVRVFTMYPLNENAQWRNATRLYIVNPYTQTISIKLELRADPSASAECNCNPYSQAFGAAKLGGGWFVEGTQASVTVGGVKKVFQTGLENYQMNFPQDFKGVWTLELSLEPGAQIILTQGERVTADDTWPLPAK